MDERLDERPPSWMAMIPGRALGASMRARESGGGCLELPHGRPSLDLDELGASIWGHLDGERDLGTIAQAVASDLDISPEEVGDHLACFVATLLQLGGLEFSAPLTVADPPIAPIEDPPVTIDFIMNVFPMAADPTGRPTSLDLLQAALPVGGSDRRAWDRIVDSMRSELGLERTVWGIKFDGTSLLWELYFCEHPRPPTPDVHGYFDDIARGFSRVGAWSAPWGLPLTAKMVSFEFTIDEGGRIDGPDSVDVYQKSEPRENVWLSYRLTTRDRSLRNSYQTHDLPTDQDGLIAWFRESRFATPDFPDGGADYWLDYIGGLDSCIGSWCARKPECDGIYLRRTHPRDLERFLADHGYPPHLREWVGRHVDQLDHLRFELSFNYTVHDGVVNIDKTGFYGYF